MQNTQLHAPAFAVLNPLQFLKLHWARITARFVAQHHDDTHERIVSDLPPHLRHDICAMEGRAPFPRTLDAKLQDRQTSLEAIWLRYQR